MSIDNLTLRPATLADVPALSRLSSAAFLAAFGHLYNPADLAGFLEETHSEHAIAGFLAQPDQAYHLAFHGDRLMGYCRMVFACGWPEHARGQNAVELKQLYTDPAATGHGVGAALMDWAMAVAQARGADEVQLSVWSENLGGQRFYARYGFAKVADVWFAVGEQRDHEFLFARLL